MSGVVGVARPAETASLGFDTLAPLPFDVLVAFRQQNFKWIGRYLENLSGDEVEAIFGAGLSILPLTEARVIPLSAELGRQSAELELGRARDLSMPRDVHITVDFEATHGSAGECDGYLRTFSKGLVLGGNPAALYVAPPQPLTGGNLFALPDFHIYWHGGGVVPELVCGYSIFQGLPLEWRAPWSSGYEVDLDVIFQDRKGRTPTLWSPS